MAENSKVVMFSPEGGSGYSNGIDPGLLALLQNNGGFNGGGSWIWILFLWIMFGANGFGNGNFNNGTGFLANQMNNDTGRDLLMQAIQGNREAIANLSSLLNTELQTVQSGILTLTNAISDVKSQVGMSGLQIQNAIQSGDATISRQICECCCENRLAIANQTNTLQQQLAANHAADQLLTAQNHSADQLALCQQTNTLQNQAERDTNTIVSAINNQTTLITKEFCDLKERELQNKIDSLTAENAVMRSNAAVTAQTAQFAQMLAPIQEELNKIRSAQPATATIQYPQLTAVPSYLANGWGWGQNSFWN